MAADSDDVSDDGGPAEWVEDREDGNLFRQSYFWVIFNQAYSIYK